MIRIVSDAPGTRLPSASYPSMTIVFVPLVSTIDADQFVTVLHAIEYSTPLIFSVLSWIGARPASTTRLVPVLKSPPPLLVIASAKFVTGVSWPRI